MQRKSEPMQTNNVSSDETQATSASPAGGLFSHPTTDHLETKAGSRPDGDQRSYTDLFREPPGGAADDE
jgi:hypothetical protein